MQFEAFYCQKSDFAAAILHELKLCSHEMIQLHLPRSTAQRCSVALLTIKENETSIKVSRQPVTAYIPKEFEKYLDKPRSRFEVLWGILKNGRYR